MRLFASSDVGRLDTVDRDSRHLPWAIARERPLLARLTRERLALAAIATLSAFLGLFRLGREGYANTYYAAAVKSMLENWHAFFFASFDSGGFVTVDKPPLGLWIQTAFAAILGFHGWSILLPQVLAAIASVILLYALVRPVFGAVAGLLAALTLAVAPINVATSRNNTSDLLLVFVLLLAAGAALRAAERGSLRWLLVSMTLVGLGFNIKMLQAYLILPALVLIYLLAPVLPLRRRIGHLALGALVLLVVSFSWATIVQLTPADARPYIGSSATNSIFNLIFGYNGLNRLLPRGWSIFGITNSSISEAVGLSAGGVGGAAENGPEGVFRLLNQQLGGQIGWLLPLAVIGLVAAWGRPILRRVDAARLSLVLWGGWLVTQVAFFSVAGFFHSYYLSMLSPAIAALVGVGVVALWHLFRAGGLRSLILPAAIVLCAASEIRILNDYPTWRDRLVPAIVIVAGLSALGLLVSFLAGRLHRPRLAVLARPLAVAGVLALLIAPATWSGITITRATAATLPLAGPTTDGFGGFGGFTPPRGSDAGRRAESAFFRTEGTFFRDGGAPGGLRGGADASLIAYLVAHQGTATYLVGVQSANQAAPIILSTGKAVMAMGGFTGRDPILTVAKLRALIDAGKVRYFLAGGGFDGGIAPAGPTGPAGSAQTAPFSARAASGRPAATQGTAQVEQWVQDTCRAVPASTYQTGTTSATSAGRAQTLYDCQGAAS